MGAREVGIVRDHTAPAIRGRTFLAFLVLADYASVDGMVYMTVRELAGAMRMSESTARRAIHELRTCGEVEPIGRDCWQIFAVATRPPAWLTGDAGSV